MGFKGQKTLADMKDYPIRPRFKFFKNLGMSKFKKMLFYEVQIQQRKRKNLVNRFFSIFKTEVPIRLINQQRINSIDKRVLHEITCIT
jgi:hypothetical protein